MKANQSIRQNDEGFSFLVPLTFVIIVVISLLVIGSFAIGEISSALEDTLPDNLEGSEFDNTYWHNNTIANTTRNVTLPCPAYKLTQTTTNFYIRNNATTENLKDIWYNLTVNNNAVNYSSYLNMGQGTNHTLASLIAGGSVLANDMYLNFTWDIDNRTATTENSHIQIRIFGRYHTSDDWRTTNQNSTIFLIGNVTEGFSDVVDIEIVVMIITALSMAIFAIMAVGTRRTSF